MLSNNQQNSITVKLSEFEKIAKEEKCEKIITLITQTIGSIRTTFQISHHNNEVSNVR